MLTPVALSPRAEVLVAQPLLAIVGTQRPKGGIQLSPVWFEYREGLFWLNSALGRSWPRNLQRDGAATLLIIAKDNDHYWLQATTALVDATTEGADAVIHRLAHRYIGRGFPHRPNEVRITFKLQPLRISGEGI